MPKVYISPRAYLDLLELWIYIAKESIDAADQLLDRIAAKCDDLAAHPNSGRERNELIPGTRSFVCHNRIIFYRITKSGIEVIRVLHGAMDIEEHVEP